MPAYELYLDGIRKGFFHTTTSNTLANEAMAHKVHLHVLLDAQRQVVEIESI